MDKVRDLHYRRTKGEIVRRTTEGEPVLSGDQYIPVIVSTDRGRRADTEAIDDWFQIMARANEEAGFRRSNFIPLLDRWIERGVSVDSDFYRNAH